jgi:hypothetical protein
MPRYRTIIAALRSATPLENGGSGGAPLFLAKKATAFPG